MFTTSELTCLAKAVSTSSFLTANIFKALMVQNPARKVNTMHYLTFLLNQMSILPTIALQTFLCFEWPLIWVGFLGFTKPLVTSFATVHLLKNSLFILSY